MPEPLGIGDSMDFIAAASTHTRFNCRVRSLASDFLLEDTWEFPYEFGAEDGVDLHLFQKSAIEPMMKGIYDGSLTGMLFRVRKVFGAFFRIDDNLNNLPIPGCREKSLRDRLQESDLEKDMPERAMDLSTRDYMSFRPVYTFADETLHEISNSTEHALMHYAWSPREKGSGRSALRCTLSIGPLSARFTCAASGHSAISSSIPIFSESAWNIGKRERCPDRIFVSSMRDDFVSMFLGQGCVGSLSGCSKSGASSSKTENTPPAPHSAQQNAAGDAATTRPRL